MQAMQLHDACNDYIWIVIVVAQRPFFGHLFLGIDSIIAHSAHPTSQRHVKSVVWADVLPLPCLKRRKVKNPSDEHDDNWGYGHDGTWGYHDEHDGNWGYHHWHSSYHSWDLGPFLCILFMGNNWWAFQSVVCTGQLNDVGWHGLVWS